MSISRRDVLTWAAATPLALVGSTIFIKGATAQNPKFGAKPYFEDHFNSNKLNRSFWNVRDSGNFMATGKTGPGPANWPSINHRSTTVDQASNVVVSNGSAKIWVRKAAIARRSPYKTGWSAGKILDHTTGYMDTIGKVEVKYGRWEIRCKMPVGPKRGVWGGMWLISNKSSQKYFEIDINEGYGFNEKKHTWGAHAFTSHNRAESSVHFAESGKNKLSKFSPKKSDNFENEWHVWAVEVLPDSGITFFLDGVKYFNVPASHPEVKARFAQDFKFNIRINLMTGHYWNITNSDTERERPLEIDYVKVWKYNG